ncbi:SsgA family sporulation/cell division regulator [Streptomyces flaveolus]|uniref:SsgA family sporulation/cell division regulator n=1 Tax=Streptomyces flaveolus TaxID=67297 RepID=UPI0006C243F6|nr:SsgA family sporulation/cell division regulator [Streptomyces antibioticus]KOG73824.1 regulator [Streptomyces antibioticus]
MSGYQPGVQASRTASHGRPQLTLDIERVLDVSTRQAIRAEFSYDPERPLIVCVEFLIEGGPRVLWRIGRDLLQQGLYSMSGFGDVQVWPTNLEERTTARLQLASGDMAALFELPVPPLAEWLERTYQLVPPGHELVGVDWDVTAADLLGGRRAASD